MVNKLINSNADVSAVNKDGKKAIDFVDTSKHPHIKRSLEVAHDALQLDQPRKRAASDELDPSTSSQNPSAKRLKVAEKDLDAGRS